MLVPPIAQGDFLKAAPTGWPGLRCGTNINKRLTSGQRIRARRAGCG